MPDPTKPDDRLRPTSTGERIEVLDILRGFALLGILVVDVNLFLAPAAGLLETVIEKAIQFFAEDSFYPLFAMLFGLGFAIQLQRADQKGLNFFPIYLRRLLVLLLIGVAHNFLIVGFSWILIRYALMGFPLLLFRRASQSTVLLWAGISLLVAISAGPTADYLATIRSATGESRDTLETPAAQAPSVSESTSSGPRLSRGDRLRKTGTYLELVAFRARRLAATMSEAAFYWRNMPDVFAMFLLGLYGARRGLIHDPKKHLQTLRRIAVGGLWAGVIGNALQFLLPLQQETGLWIAMGSNATRLLGGIGFALFYAGTIIILVQRWNRPGFLAALAWPGRMALTNYLLQWKLCAWIFYGYGLGYYQSIGPVIALPLGFAIFAVEIVGSRWWLQRFRIGPAEWFWRKLTYLGGGASAKT